MHIEDTGAHTDDIIALQAIELSRIRGQLQEARNEQLMKQTVIMTYGLQMLSAAMIRDCLKRSNEDLKGQLKQSQNDLADIQARNEELLAELSESNDASVALQDQLRTSEAEWATSVNQLGTQLFDAHCNQGALEMRIYSLEEELCKVQKEKCIIEKDLAAAHAAQSGSREELLVTLDVGKEPRNCIWTELLSEQSSNQPLSRAMQASQSPCPEGTDSEQKMQEEKRMIQINLDVAPASILPSFGN